MYIFPLKPTGRSFKRNGSLVLNQKTVSIIHCISIYYKKKNSVPITMGIFSINQTEFTVQRAVYTYFFITNFKKFPMVTVTINIKPYLAGYMYVRYRQSLEPDPENQSHSSSPSPSSSKRLIPIHLSHITPVYHFLHQLSVPHPQNTSWKEIGNIWFVLPKPRNGKNPEVYNYIGNDSALIIEKEIETEMKAELYSFLLDNKFNKGVMFKKSIEQFVEHYEMVGLVQEETLMRAFQRWRKLVKEEKAIKL